MEYQYVGVLKRPYIGYIVTHLICLAGLLMLINQFKLWYLSFSLKTKDLGNELATSCSQNFWWHTADLALYHRNGLLIDQESLLQ